MEFVASDSRVWAGSTQDDRRGGDALLLCVELRNIRLVSALLFDRKRPSRVPIVAIGLDPGAQRENENSA